MPYHRAPIAVDGICFTSFAWFIWNALGTLEWQDMRGCFDRLHPSFLSPPGYHQQAIAKFCSTSTKLAIKSRRCLNISSTITPTAKILRTLIILLVVVMCGTTALSPTIGLNYWHGYHPWTPAYDIATFKSVVSTMSGNGLWGQRDLEDGAD